MTKELEAGSPSAPRPARPATTPGPWVVTRDKIAVATQAPIGGNIICEAPEGFRDSMENWAGNARLIAASLDLHAVAEQVINVLYEASGGEPAQLPEAEFELWNAARAALSKAGA